MDLQEKPVTLQLKEVVAPAVKMSGLDRMVLLLTGLLAAYQIVVGIDGMDGFAIAAYTIAFGVLLVAVLLLIILGFDALDAPIVVIISTVIPLCLATGLVWQHIPALRIPYLLFAILGFAAVALTRSITMTNRARVLTLAIVHGIAGLTIFLLPSVLAAQGKTDPRFALVGIGGALIGIGGLLLSFLKAGRPILSRQTILRIFPGLLLLMTLCFVAGFKYG
jgi:type IV secretory pathway TrbD component